VLEAWEHHEQPIRRPMRGTATKERTRAASGSDEPIYDDSAEAIRGLTEGPGWQGCDR
jgi:hypothetical protein